MLPLKKFDAYAQIVLIVSALIFTLTAGKEAFFLSCFIVGGWQVLSALIHLIGFSKIPVFKGRKWYLFTLLFLLITGLLSASTSDFILYFGFGLLIISPLLAIWYAAICFGEIKLWEQRETPEIIETI